MVDDGPAKLVCPGHASDNNAEPCHEWPGLKPGMTVGEFAVPPFTFKDIDQLQACHK